MVETKYGKVAGIHHGWYTEYLGVPYAKPPVGELRWKAPQQMESYEGVYHAVQFPNKAVQAEGSSPPWDKDFYDDPQYIPKSSEDCLYLNIYVPQGAKDCPVAFWIHGGAFLGGNASEKEFDGAEYCRRGVILVSVQYRLGLFGFLAHPWLTEEAGTSGNYGILDQIAALKWVHENIAAFGGNPENITVFGQSAGAMSVQTLISSPMTKDLIKKAIMQSGGSYGEGLHRDITLKEQESFGMIFSEVLNVNSLAQMREKSAEEIFAAFGPFMQKAQPLARGLFLVPTIDGQVLTKGYYELMDSGEIKDIPYMLGCTKNDIMTAPGRPVEESSLYRGSVAFSKKLEELGRNPAYVYCFIRDLPGDQQGAWHSAELWYTMGTIHRCWRPWTCGDYVLATKILDYWSNFMKNGDPNAEGLPAWRNCSNDDAFVLKLDIDESQSV